MWSEIESRIDCGFYKPEYDAVVKKIKLKSHIKLGNLVRFVDSPWDQKSIYNAEFPYIEIGAIDLSDGSISTIKQVDIRQAPSRAKKLVYSNDVIVSATRPSRGAVVLISNDQDKNICSTGFMILRDIKTSIYSKKALQLLLRTSFVLKQCEQRQSGGNYPAIIESEYKKIVVPLINDSHQLDLIISTWDDAIKVRNAKLKQADEFLKSIDTYLLSELNLQLPELKNDLVDRKYIVNSKEVIGNRFDGFYNRPEFINFFNEVALLSNSTTLFDVVYSESGVVYKADDERDEGLGILRANNIDVESNELDLTDIKYINNELDLPNRQKLYANDILMCSASGSKSHAGKVAFIEKDLSYYFGGFMTVLRAKHNVNMRYVFEYMCSSVYRTLLFRSLGGTNINNVNYELIKNIPIILPHNQDDIVNRIVAIRKQAKQLKSEAQQCLDLARTQIEQIILGE